VIPPFEAEAAILTPVLSELVNTRSDAGDQAPVIAAPAAPTVSPVTIEPDWTDTETAP
jgi:hypothetical protein